MLYTYNESTFKDIFEYFNNNIYSIPEFPFKNIYYTDNMQEDIKLFCTPKEFENSDNKGVTLLPNEYLNEIIVVIDISSNNMIDFVRTLMHELIHVYDFINFSKYYFSKPFIDISKHKLFETFRGWSEFKAFAYSDYHTYKYMDATLNANNTSIAMTCFESNLKPFLETKRQMVLDGGLNFYDLVMILGYIYALDNYHHIQKIENSCVYKYLPLVFHSNLKDNLYHLFELYFESCHNNNVFLNLTKMKNIEDQIIHVDKAD